MGRNIKIFIAIMALAALSQGVYDGVMANYLREVYHIDGFYRGLLEVPRETPGLLCILFVTLFASRSDIKTAVFAQILVTAGMMFLGFVNPYFSVVIVVLVIHSAGMHVFLAMQDSIGVKLTKGEALGTWLGRFKGVTIAFTMLASLVIFLGFRSGLFNFEKPLKLIFILAGIASLLSAVLLYVLDKKEKILHEKPRWVFKKEYMYFYILTALRGAQKQTLFVFGPWVLIETLGKHADYTALLTLIGSFIGVFFTPLVGRLTDQYGIKKMLYADAWSYIGIYIVFGILTSGFISGWLPAAGVPVLAASAVLIMDNMSAQIGMIRVIYLNSILKDPADLTPTISMGCSFDHAVSITFGLLGGVLWATLGGQYIFFCMAGLSLVNLLIAYKVSVVEKIAVRI